MPLQENKDNKINFIFWGTPDVASNTLEILKQNNLVPTMIITSPDKPQGRKMLITPSPTKTWAIENNIPYLQPEKLDEEFTEKLKSIPKDNNDLFIVVAYGKIIPENIINMPKFGSLNIHYSLLPKWRGASPVESSILNGDTITGVSIQKMFFKMDSGPLIAQKETNIIDTETTPELRNRLIKIGAELLVNTLPDFLEKKIVPKEQNEEEITLAKKIKKEDGLIDFNDSDIKNYNKFRAYYKWPRVFFFQKEKRVIITEATLEDNKFTIKKVLPEGKNEMMFEEFKKSNYSN